MAIRQVREVNGQRVLSEPIAGFGGGSDETWGKYVEGTVPEDPSTIIADMPVGSYVTDDKPTIPASVPAPYNKEVWITESGTWTAPVTGWYEILLIGSGGGSLAHDTTFSSGSVYILGGEAHLGTSYIKYLVEGQEFPVTIASGGIGIKNVNDSSSRWAGTTSFGSLTSSVDDIWRGVVQFGTATSPVQVYGVGRRGGHVVSGSESGIGYGSGAAAAAQGNASRVGNGAPGAIRLRYYDSSKEQD